MTRASVLALSLLVVSGAAHGGSFGEKAGQVDAERRTRVPPVFANLETHEDVQSFVGVRVVDCTAAPDGGEICTWRLGHSSPAWKPLAAALGSRRDRLHVVARFGSDPSEPLRFIDAWLSNSRWSPWYKIPPTPRERRTKRKKLRAENAQRHEDAQAYLAEARTLDDLLGVMGFGPASCSRDGALYLCVWHLTRITWGHALLAATIESDKKLRLECRLPAGGGPRSTGSCDVVIDR